PAGLPAIPDRRQTRLYQLAAEGIVVRGYDYPPLATGGQIAGCISARGDLGGFALVAKGRPIVFDADGGELPAAVVAATPWATTLGAAPAHLLLDFIPTLSKPAAALTLLGNIAPASQGETQPDDPLANADASVPFASYPLRRAPLTYIATPA